MPPGDQAKNYYPFLDFSWADYTVIVTLGPTHWSDYSTVRHGVLELVRKYHCTFCFYLMRAAAVGSVLHDRNHRISCNANMSCSCPCHDFLRPWACTVMGQ